MVLRSARLEGLVPFRCRQVLKSVFLTLGLMQAVDSAVVQVAPSAIETDYVGLEDDEVDDSCRDSLVGK